MNIQVFPSGPFSTNAYVVSCAETGESAIIDPAPNSAGAIFKYCDEHHFTPKKIIITHSHWDHIADTSVLKKHFHSDVYVHPLDAPNLREPGSDGLPLMIAIEGVEPDKLLNEGDIVEVGNLRFAIIHTPGHCRGSICLYSKEHQTVFVGDTMFKGSIGNLSLPTSKEEDMWVSLPKLAKLPPETKVYPGHGPTTTIGKETWLSNAKHVFGY
jgi:glyoxylase-like metal-dependent hydrolase (beta-lactamase superfamily II)